MNKSQSKSNPNLHNIENLPDLEAILADDSDIPTRIKINLVAQSVGRQNVKISSIADDVAEIKTTFKSIQFIAKLLIISVPIVAAVFSGATWLFFHITIK
jgi:hypothetical protein